ncbi:hypothetical protein KSS87_003178, partial [Heliosperma pusillum]
MNAQSHMSGQFVGQVPNQASNQLPGMLQQNGNPFHSQVQNMSGQSNPPVIDTEIVIMRRFIREKIYEILMMRQSQPSELVSKKLQDFTRRLEEGLFRSATTKEEYINVDTLEARLQALVRRHTPTNHMHQHSQFVNNTAPVATMVPTPVNPTVMNAGTGGYMSSSIPTAGSMMPVVNGPFSGMRGGAFGAGEGSLSNVCQPLASGFPMNSGGNNIMAGQRPMNQMIPTPGLSGRNNHMLVNVDGFNNNGILSSVDSLMASQQVPQRHAGGQNNIMLQNLGSGRRSLMQHRFQNGIINNGVGNNVQMVNESGSSSNYLTMSSFGASSGPLLQLHGTLQQPVVVQGDSSGSGNFCSTGASAGSLLNNQNADQVRTSLTPRASSLVNSGLAQLNYQSAQLASYLRPHMAEQVEKVNFQPSLPPRENQMQISTTQYQQQLHQMPQQQQLTAYPQQRQPGDLLVQPTEAYTQQMWPSDQSQISVRNEAYQFQSTSDNGNPVNSEYAMDHQNEGFQQSFSGHIQVPELQNPLQYNTNENLSINNQLSSLSSNPQPMMAGDGTNELSKQPLGAQQEVLHSSHWHPVPDRPSLARNISHEHNAQEAFLQGIVGNADVQCINLSSEVSSNDRIVTPGSIADQPRLGSRGCSSNGHCDQNFKNQLRWLLFLRHARSCRAPPGECLESNCILVQKLLDHLDSCKNIPCSYPRCAQSKRLLNHQRNCRDLNCPVCVPYLKFIRVHKKLCTRQDPDGLQRSINGPFESAETIVVSPIVASPENIKPSEVIKPSELIVVSPENKPPVKRIKSELPSQFHSSENDSTYASVNAINAPQAPQSVQSSEYGNNDDYFQINSEYGHLKAENSNGSDQNGTEIKQPSVDIASCQRFDGGSVLNHVTSLPEEEIEKPVKENGQLKPEGVVQPPEQVGTKSGKPNIKGVSLIELFTPEQVREHITGLRRWVGQSKAKAEKNQAMEQTMSENSCQLCAVEKLSFEPPPIYCTPCGARIKRNAMYYTV